jgi:hypothetical protein
VEVLGAAGAEAQLLDVTSGCDLRGPSVLDGCRRLDAVVLAEHRDRRTLIGGETGVPIDVLEQSGAVLAHIAGAIEDPHSRLHKYPPGDALRGRMTVTTDVVGPRPVVDLHTAGLSVGQMLVEKMRQFGHAAAAETSALEEPLCVRANPPVV